MWCILSIFFKYDRLEIIWALGFEICETFPNSIKLLLHSLVEFLDYQLVNNIILFINVIICLSYPLNFAIYCGMSRSSILFMNPFLNKNQYTTTITLAGSSGRLSAVFSSPPPSTCWEPVHLLRRRWRRRRRAWRRTRAGESSKNTDTHKYTNTQTITINTHTQKGLTQNKSRWRPPWKQNP